MSKNRQKIYQKSQKIVPANAQFLSSRHLIIFFFSEILIDFIQLYRSWLN